LKILNHPHIARRFPAKWPVSGLSSGIRFAIIGLALAMCGCSLDPIGELFQSSTGPFTEQVGPYLRITHNPGPDLHPAWSSDGSMIAYSAWGFEELTQSQITVNTIPAEGGVSTRISPVFSRIDYDYFPCWFDNDSQIAFITFGGLNFSRPLEPTVTVVDLTGNQANVDYSPGMNSPLDFEISPDGRAIAYSDFLTTNFYSGLWGSLAREDIFLIPLERVSNSITFLWYADLPVSEEARKIEGTRGATGLSWSPDSNLLAFSKDGEIYTISSDGGAAQLLFEGESPAWSPDGSRIACEIDDNLFVYELSNGGRLQITTEGGIHPAWSPDGEKLAFSWDRGGNYDIYVVNLDDVIGMY
jgi:Tol biopolymer transport system component